MNVNCYDCGLEYGGDGWIEAVVPDSVWEMIKPIGSSKGSGILCISCMCKRLRKLGLQKVPCFINGTEPIEIFSQEHKEKEFILRKWKPK